MSDLVIDVDDPDADDVRALLAVHLEFANEVTPPGHVHALAVDGLLDPSVAFFSARQDGALLGVGAIRRLDAAHAELKSMHVAAAARGQGVGRAMVDRLLALARDGGFTRVSLETGTYRAFEPARTMYAAAGFRPCPPFAHYTDNMFSTCMTIDLPRRATREDAGPVAEVWLRSRRASLPAIPAPVHSDDEVRAWFADVVLASKETWVIEQDEAVVALLVLDDGWIDQLYVDPQHTGRQLGSRLVELAKERSPAGLELWTFQTNTGAIAFYERHGFTEVARTDGDNEERAPDLRLHWTSG